MRIKTDKLSVSCYALHGDTCAIAPHCETLGCASGHKATDYVLAARFAYLQEAIDYCHVGAKRGVKMRLVSRIVSTPHVSQYEPDGKGGFTYSVKG